MNSWVKNNIIFLVLFVFMIASLFLFISATKTKSLEVVFLDVGQGDATLITTPNGLQVLIDAGAKDNLGEKISPYMSVSDRSLDMVILTHPDLDHVGGMISLLKYYDIDIIIHSGLLAGAPIYNAIVERINHEKIPTITAEAGQLVEIDQGVYLEVYSPYTGYESFEANDYSVVMRLTYGNTSMLLTGDATKSIEYEIVNTYGNILDSDILKIGHHGSQTSTSELLVSTVSPQYGIISAGCDNRFGHPHAGVLATLFTAKVEIFDTCNNGDVVFESDGKEWIIK